MTTKCICTSKPHVLHCPAFKSELIERFGKQSAQRLVTVFSYIDFMSKDELKEVENRLLYLKDVIL